MAYASNAIYVATCNVPFAFTKDGQVNGAPPSTATVSGTVVALNATTGAIEWSTKVDTLPVGAMTISNNLVFTTLVTGKLVAFNRATGAVVFTQKLPRTTNSTLAIAGNTIIVPTGGPKYGAAKGKSQIIAYAVPS
jgi:alcohol dehydrogenase (cytochrome c)